MSTLLTPLLGLFTVISSLLAHTALWQRKEYRIDRLRALLRDIDRDRTALLCYGGALLLAIAASFIPQQNILAFLGLMILAVFSAWRASQRGILRPHVTARAVYVLIASVVLLVALGWILRMRSDTYEWLLLALATPLLVAVAVILIALPASVRKQQLIRQATRKRKSLSGLTVIGITGSYGKTSTKEFLGQILATLKKPHVLSDARRNAPYPLAQDMMARLKVDTPLYIAEMGAYRRGEIADLGKLVQPTVAAITAVANQHLELFGSRENLANAKWELAEALPEDGILVINADDTELERRASSFSGKVMRFSLKNSAAADITFSITHVEAKSFTVTVAEGTQTATAHVPLAGEHQLLAVAASTSLARSLKLPLDEVGKALASLQPIDRTMEVVSGVDGSTVIDDSYSANEQGVVAAVHHLKYFEGSKLIILTPLIELGPEAEEVHERIGHELAQSEASVIVTGVAHRGALERGWNRASSNAIIQFVTDPAKTIDTVRENVRSDFTVLLEGRIPAALRDFIRSS